MAMTVSRGANTAENPFDDDDDDADDEAEWATTIGLVGYEPSIQKRDNLNTH
jgi:hypothetical protein